MAVILTAMRLPSQRRCVRFVLADDVADTRLTDVVYGSPVNWERQWMSLTSPCYENQYKRHHAVALRQQDAANIGFANGHMERVGPEDMYERVPVYEVINMRDGQIIDVQPDSDDVTF